jgi:acyl carrier protein
MSSPAANNANPASAANRQAECVRHLPEPARAAFEQFQVGADAAALDPVLFAILGDYIPKTPARPISEMPGGSRLMEDLGFDSLAITEVVFFTEELFQISISNEEIVQVRTLDDLRSFIRGKVAASTVR